MSNQTSILKRAYCRAGLLGNPSDGYGGKTISLSVKNYFAEVQIKPASNVSILPGPEENPSFDSIYQLAEHVQQVGYFGGLRLIKATIKTFIEFVGLHQNIDCDAGFSIDYRSNIPRSVGLAGSSAIVVATLKALIEFFGASIESAVLASLALSVEKDELNIPAGLQDRVIQVMGGMVYMDFSSRGLSAGMECGKYTAMNCPFPQNLYIAFGTRAAEPTEALHGDLRKRYEQNEKRVVDAMVEFAKLAERGRAAIETADSRLIAQLIDANFDLRSSICDINPFHRKMVEKARETGASAKFCGSGGAIIGTFVDQDGFDELTQAMNKIDCQVFKPTIE